MTMSFSLGRRRLSPGQRMPSAVIVAKVFPEASEAHQGAGRSSQQGIREDS